MTIDQENIHYSIYRRMPGSVVRAARLRRENHEKFQGLYPMDAEEAYERATLEHEGRERRITGEPKNWWY